MAHDRGSANHVKYRLLKFSHLTTSNPGANSKSFCCQSSFFKSVFYCERRYFKGKQLLLTETPKYRGWAQKQFSEYHWEVVMAHLTQSQSPLREYIEPDTKWAHTSNASSSAIYPHRIQYLILLGDETQLLLSVLSKGTHVTADYRTHSPSTTVKFLV